jgi:drug/metabolite transporter (DMT)-like permease
MKAILFAVLAGLCWGVGELCTKSVLSSGKVGPMTVLLVRTAVALPPALLAYWLAMSVFKSEPPGWIRAPTPVTAKLLLGSALGAGFGGVLFFYLGLANGQVSVVKPIAFTVGPAAAVLLSWLVLKEPMNPPKAIGVGLVLAGIVLIAGFGGQHAKQTPATPAASSP